ncbi:uncharacterized protein Z518_03301 [Rhinocladiella mackenziei CBS 650.93]|uniref:Rhinocladiella mackenziei CBS 650.93 unplaced genomic scaffold supercont1.2, whole genome shotgun sequence n=1 Tax=Rhinocladiella mackenziei CBS 650.93 TaxID=1442369 RepID=A0A0D2IRM9_9EURO|nr:uncharacterized protein Z518_03301 [Rhinocladiella mackenziei CBS 650.93]KIX08644.1 hypothetical protein Z518_03301 [Rhinocladiella mackenziei CBS 650.93]
MNPYTSNGLFSPVQPPPGLFTANRPALSMNTRPSVMPPPPRVNANDGEDSYMRQPVAADQARGRQRLARPAAPQPPHVSASKWKAYLRRRSESKEINVATDTPTPAPRHCKNSSAKGSLGKFADKLKSAFLAQENQRMVEGWIDDVDESNQPPVVLTTLEPAHQARIFADLQVMLNVSANKFLIEEANAARLNPETVVGFAKDWKTKHGDPVVEFLYDVEVQYRLVLANLKTIKFRGRFENNYVAVNASLCTWVAYAQNLTQGILCLSDDVVTKYVYDLPPLLEMLGASEITRAALTDLQLRVMGLLGARTWLYEQEQRAKSPYPSTINQYGDGLYHKRSIQDPSPHDMHHGIEYAVRTMPPVKIPAGFPTSNAPAIYAPKHPSAQPKTVNAQHPATPDQPVSEGGPGPTTEFMCVVRQAGLTSRK